MSLDINIVQLYIISWYSNNNLIEIKCAKMINSLSPGRCLCNIKSVNFKPISTRHFEHPCTICPRWLPQDIPDGLSALGNGFVPIGSNTLPEAMITHVSFYVCCSLSLALKLKFEFLQTPAKNKVCLFGSHIHILTRHSHKNHSHVGSFCLQTK